MLQAYRLYLFQTIFAEGADAMPPCVQYDDLWPDGPRFARSGAGFALGTDSVLLADFCSIRPGERAIELGLDPIRAIRYATINPAVRLRLYRTGGIAPGMEADIQLVQDLRHPRPELVLRAGEIVWDHGSYLPHTAPYQIPDHLQGSVHLRPVTEEDFAVTVPVRPGFSGGTAVVNLIGQDGVSIRTQRVRKALPLSAERDGFACLKTAPYLKMAVFNRYGRDQHGIGLLTGMDGVTGAAALTYGHDCHNLTVYGGNDADMALAANTLRESQGGLCTVENGKVLTLIPLPLAGLMCDLPPEVLLEQMEHFPMGAHDDGVDALEGCRTIAKKMKRFRVLDKGKLGL